MTGRTTIRILAACCAATAFCFMCGPATAAPARNRAIIIGINGYYRMGRLEYCATDAKAVAAGLLRGGLFRQEDVVLMTDDSPEPQNRPTLANMEARLENLADLSGKTGILLVFFAGHGETATTGREEDVRLIPIDCSKDKGIKVSRIRKWLNACRAENTMLILDCCHAGKEERAAHAIVPSMAAGDGVTLLASCQSDQQSYDIPESSHGVFSLYLASGLSGKADADMDGSVTSGELFEYVRDSVSQWAFKKNKKQTPVLLPGGEEKDIVLAQIRTKGEGGIQGDIPTLNVPELKLPDLDVQGLDIPHSELTGLKRVNELETLLAARETELEKQLAATQAEIDEKRESYAPHAEIMKSLAGRKTELKKTIDEQKERFRDAMVEEAIPAARALGKRMKALDAEWKKGEEQGLLPAHPEMKKIAGARDETLNTLGRLARILPASELSGILELPPQKAAAVRLGLPLYRTIELGEGVSMKLVLVPDGEFMMGSPVGEGNRDSDEGPVHRIRMAKGYYIGTCEVTQAQYQAVMGTNPSRFKGPGKPVEKVSWDDAAEFCRKLSEKAGAACRLPTEAEWEYACRGGTAARFPFGDAAKELGEYAWFETNSAGSTHPAGEKKPNPWELYDMHGNVREWCLDRYGKDYYAESPGENPPGPSSGNFRVLRGGGWDDSPGSCRSASRERSFPANRFEGIGFRVVLEAPQADR